MQFNTAPKTGAHPWLRFSRRNSRPRGRRFFGPEDARKRRQQVRQAQLRGVVRKRRQQVRQAQLRGVVRRGGSKSARHSCGNAPPVTSTCGGRVLWPDWPKGRKPRPRGGPTESEAGAKGRSLASYNGVFGQACACSWSCGKSRCWSVKIITPFFGQAARSREERGSLVEKLDCRRRFPGVCFGGHVRGRGRADGIRTTPADHQGSFFFVSFWVYLGSVCV